MASKCPQEGGRVVYYARGILPLCIRKEITDNYEGCYPQIEPILDTIQHHTDRSLTDLDDLNNEQNLTILIYPNPAKNSIQVKVTSDSNGVFNVYNYLGIPVISNIRGNETTIDISLLTSGFYFVRYHSNLYSFVESSFIKI